MASLWNQSQSYLVCQIIYYEILHFQCKCKNQERRHKNCYYFVELRFVDKYLVDKCSYICFSKVLPSFSQSKSLINQTELFIFRTLIVPSILSALTQSPSLWVREKFPKIVLGLIPVVFQLLESLWYFQKKKYSSVKEILLLL